MTRPSIVRADTIDLQDHHAPSASKHSTAPLNPSFAPHQAETLREVAQETAVEESRSPRLSWNNGTNDHDLHQYAQELTAGVTKSINGGAMQNKDEEDALAVAQNGGVSSSDEGDMDGDGDGDGDLDDDMMDKISSSPSIEDEEIDFEFVYALHTFVATVEGQANATKGDTMVLLDDSNSYWWLVRVVKDSSIGYLPAEHIETPTERLARLNKHRNVDLSATMLGDQAIKPRNPFMPGIRRKRKTVVFAEPTYVDYPEIDYSTEEEDIDELFGKQPVTAQQQIEQQKAEEEQKQQAQQQAQSQDTKQDAEAQNRQKPSPDATAADASNDVIRVQPLVTRSSKKEVDISEPVREETAEELERDRAQDEDEVGIDPRLEAPSRSRNGNIRNTDSFFRDDTVETKKITLTPNLLRDDNAAAQNMNDPVNRDIKSRTSMEKMEKELMSDKDRKKREKEKREKEKKPSAIRSFFSRKDKKKTIDDDDESFGKRSMDTPSEPRESEDPMSVEQSPEKGSASQKAKLQKPQPRFEQPVIGKVPPIVGPKPTSIDYNRANDVSNVPPASMRIVDPETNETKEVPSNQQLSRESSRDRSTSGNGPRDDRAAMAAKSSIRTVNSGPESHAPRAPPSKARMDLDLSSDEEGDVFGTDKRTIKPGAESESAHVPPPQRPAPTPASDDKALRPQLPGAFPDSYQSASTVSSDKTVTPFNVDTTTAAGRLSESPVEVSPVSPVATKPPGLVVDMSSQEGISPESSPSPDFIHADEASKDGSLTTASKEDAWDDSKLRAFFDDSDHVRDLLVVVYDKSNMAADSGDHPIAGTLFREQNAQLAEITTRLDNMLGDWLARKQRRRGAL